MTIAYISQNEEIWNPNVQRPLQCSGIGKNTISDKLTEVINTLARLFNTKSLCSYIPATNKKLC